MSTGVYNGLGDMQTVGNQVVIPATSIAGAAFAGKLATLLAVSVPVVGAAIAGVTIALTAIFNRRGPQQKVIATQAANEVEQVLQTNVQEYMRGPRTPESRMLALANFDAAWSWLTSPDGCGRPELGNPGERCISERARGGYAPWCPTGTGCDWFILYRDPIASDVPVTQEPASSAIAAAAAGGGGDLLSVFGIQPATPDGQPSNLMPLLLALGLISVGVMMK